MVIDLTPIALALISIIGTIITTYLIPYLRERYTKEQLEKALIFGKIAVDSAEQLAKSGVIKPEERKEHAMNVLTEFLKSKNIKLDIGQINNIIESFVVQLPKFITNNTQSDDTTDYVFEGDEGIK
jgi:Na+/glutamate symporter